METKLIECKLIDALKVDGSRRTFSKEFAVRLAGSLKIDGQLTPIVVRPNPATPGRYILVAGKHRLYAIKNVNKEQSIEAKILEDMDQAEADVLSTVENLFRNSLSKAQHALALKTWHTHWLARMPAIEPAPKAEVAAVAADAATPEPTNQSDRKSAEGQAEASPVADAASETAFNEKVAAVTGQSAVTVQRSKSIANAFTAEQLEVFVQMDVNQTDMLTIAKIKDVGHRAEVVALIASGMVPAEAIKEVMKDAAPSRYNNGGAAADAAKATAKAEKEPELTDDEWYAASCSEMNGMLGNPAKFKSDAILFRRHSDLRHAYRAKGKKALAETKKAGVTGPFYNLVNRLLSIAHPKDWLLCPECKGQGKVAFDASAEEVAKFGPGYTTKNCQKCFGGGYLLKTEEYL